MTTGQSAPIAGHQPNMRYSDSRPSAGCTLKCFQTSSPPVPAVSETARRSRRGSLLPADGSLTVSTIILSTALALLSYSLITLHVFCDRAHRTTSVAIGQPTRVHSRPLTSMSPSSTATTLLWRLASRRTTHDEHEASVKRNVLRRIFLADRSRFGRESRYQNAAISDIDLLITDNCALQRQLNALFRVDVVEVANVEQ